MDTKIPITKEQIIAAAQEVFGQLGFNKVTMAIIADATKMGRSSLYYYFKNKSEVFEAVAEAFFKEILEAAKKEISPSQSFAENYYKFQSKRIALILDQISKFDNLIIDLRENPTIINSIKQNTKTLEIEILDSILTLAIEKGEIARLSSEDQQFLSKNLICAFKNLEQELFLHGQIEELTSRLQWMTQILYKGLQ